MLIKEKQTFIKFGVLMGALICVNAQANKDIDISLLLSARAQQSGWSVIYDVGVDIPITDTFINAHAPSDMYFPQAAKRLVSQLNERTHEQVIVISCKENKSILVTTLQRGVESHRRYILGCNDGFVVN